MQTSNQEAVLRRKLAVPSEDAPSGPPESPLARAISLGLPRASTALIELDIQVLNVAERQADLSELLETVPDDGLFAVLDGPTDEQGLLVLDSTVLGTIVEIQMTGRLAETPPPSRRPTRTDAALCADLIDLMLREFDTVLAEEPRVTGGQGYGYSTFFAETRPLTMLLEDMSFTVLDLELKLKGRTAKAHLALPFLTVEDDGRPVAGATVKAHPGLQDAEFNGTLCRAIAEGAIRFEAVLHRFHMPWSDAVQMQPGQTITVPVQAIGETRLLTSEGDFVTKGRLGQAGGFRALLLNPADAGAMVQSASATDASDIAAVVAARAAPPMPTSAQLPDPAEEMASMAMPADEPAPMDLDPMDLDALADLPDMSDLPAVSDLPELPDLPDLPDL